LEHPDQVRYAAAVENMQSALGLPGQMAQSSKCMLSGRIVISQA